MSFETMDIQACALHHDQYGAWMRIRLTGVEEVIRRFRGFRAIHCVIVLSLITRVVQSFVRQGVCESRGMVQLRGRPVAVCFERRRLGGPRVQRIRPLQLVFVHTAGDTMRGRGTGRVIVDGESGMHSGRAGRGSRPATIVVRYGVHNHGRQRRGTRGWMLPVDGRVVRVIHGGRGMKTGMPSASRMGCFYTPDPLRSTVGVPLLHSGKTESSKRRDPELRTDRWTSGCSGPKPGMRDGLSQRVYSRVRWFKTVPSGKFGIHSFSRCKA